MSELKMTLNQIKNQTIQSFAQGYDNPEDFNECANAANQEFHCCGDDCPDCSGNNECRNCCSTSSNHSCSSCTCTQTTDCPDENLESCTIERIWEMNEYTPPQNINDEHGTNVHMMKIIRITKNYRNS